MKKIVLLALLSPFTFHLSPCHSQCADALMQYAQCYPAAESQDVYKLVFQDLYGPGHLITNADDAMRYISKEVAEMSDTTPFPMFEYTLCDSNFVRVNLIAVKRGIISLEQLVSALMRSAEGLPTPDPKFAMTHSTAFKSAYNPHYRIIRRDIFDQEFKTLLLQ